MAPFSVEDLYHVESAPGTLADLRSKVGEMIKSSAGCFLAVDSLDPETGEYRIVLQGTLEEELLDWG
jgi:hypothetical protein